MDTLDGSSGFTFTYLPIVFEDDSQVCSYSNKFVETEDASYVIEIEFLGDNTDTVPFSSSVPIV